MRKPSTVSRRRMFALLLFLSGAVFLLSSVAYNEYVLALVDPYPPLGQLTIEQIRQIQLCFAVMGLVILGLSVGSTRVSWLDRLGRTTWAAKFLLASLVSLQPLLMAEMALKPFADPKTTIFTRDKDLGWKLRPFADDVWGRVRVRINGKGLRGPELDYAKKQDVKRILYLGDSVTFGFRLKRHEDTFPYQIEYLLESQNAYEIETINAGVGGYSPWQEFMYLENEGVKYEPDLVIVSFVLNDVTEKFDLLRFGGSEEGWQLGEVASSQFDWWLHKSSIFYFAKKVSGRIRFGQNVPEAASHKEAIDVRSLAFDPQSQITAMAWKVTLENLKQITDFCENRRIPILLVAFPFTFQFEDPEGLSAPQARLIEFASEQGIGIVDLLPMLSRDMREQQKSVGDYFMDYDHLTSFGCRRVAHLLATSIEEHGLLGGEAGSNTVLK